jgi:hypothetical protein
MNMRKFGFGGLNSNPTNQHHRFTSYGLKGDKRQGIRESEKQAFMKGA